MKKEIKISPDNGITFKVELITIEKNRLLDCDTILDCKIVFRGNIVECESYVNMLKAGHIFLK